jgi:hypothetical protein
MAKGCVGADLQLQCVGDMVLVMLHYVRVREGWCWHLGQAGKAAWCYGTMRVRQEREGGGEGGQAGRYRESALESGRCGVVPKPMVVVHAREQGGKMWGVCVRQKAVAPL